MCSAPSFHVCSLSLAHFSLSHSPPPTFAFLCRQPGAGTYLMSSSYDKTCKIFSCQDWSLVKTLSGHEDKVMRAEISPGAVSATRSCRCQFAGLHQCSCADSLIDCKHLSVCIRHLNLHSPLFAAPPFARFAICTDSKHIATVCWDRSWKLWGL